LGFGVAGHLEVNGFGVWGLEVDLLVNELLLVLVLQEEFVDIAPHRIAFAHRLAARLVFVCKRLLLGARLVLV
jgi:hypothetical protein